MHRPVSGHLLVRDPVSTPASRGALRRCCGKACQDETL